MGVLLEALFRLVDAHQREHLHGAGFGLLLVAVGVQRDGLHQLVADGEHRVQAGHGVLKNDGAAFAAEVFQLLFTPFCNIFPFVKNLSSGDAAVFRQNLHDGVGGDGFAGAGFAHDAENLARLQTEGHAVDRVDLAALVGGEGGVQILHIQNILPVFRFAHGRPLLSVSVSGQRHPADHRPAG